MNSQNHSPRCPDRLKAPYNDIFGWTSTLSLVTEGRKMELYSNQNTPSAECKTAGRVLYRGAVCLVVVWIKCPE